MTIEALRKATCEQIIGKGHVHPRTQLRVQRDPTTNGLIHVYTLDKSGSVTDLIIMDQAQFDLLAAWVSADHGGSL